MKKGGTLEKGIGSYLLISIPYGDVILLRDELAQIWGLLPYSPINVEQIADCMRSLGISADMDSAAFVLAEFKKMGLVTVDEAFQYSID